MSDDTFDLRKERNTREGQQALRQLLNTDGPKGVSKQYSRGYTFNFEFTQEQRDAVNKLMESGMPFDKAFELYTISLDLIKEIQREYAEDQLDLELTSEP